MHGHCQTYFSLFTLMKWWHGSIPSSQFSSLDWACRCDSHSGFRSGRNSLVYSVSQQVMITYLLCMRPLATPRRDWMSLQIQQLPSILFTLGRETINKSNKNKKGKIKMNCDHYCVGNRQHNWDVWDQSSDLNKMAREGGAEETVFGLLPKDGIQPHI